MDKLYAIFDMDGTLIDSMPYWKNLAAEYLSSKGVDIVPPDILKRIAPMTMTESAELFKQEFGLKGDIAAEMNAMIGEHYRRDIPLKPGVREYLRKLQSRGVTMCAASATAEYLMDACLTRLNVRDCFAFLLSCETVGAGKNRPDVYFTAAKHLNAEPSATAVYEDAVYAIQTAKSAGFHVVGVYDPAANWDEAVKIADETIQNWEEAI